MLSSRDVLAKEAYECRSELDSVEVRSQIVEGREGTMRLCTEAEQAELPEMEKGILRPLLRW